MKPKIPGRMVLCAVPLVLCASPLAHAVNGYASNNEFNPAVSLILDGRYSQYDELFDLPGFQIGGEAGLPEEGFTIGHSELTLSANIDDLLYGEGTLAIAEHDGETEVELEEAFVETLGLGYGTTLKFGKFFSHLGYHNALHAHAWDFIEAPLVYSGLMGNHIISEGIQARWVPPLDIYTELGIEVSRGIGFPGGENEGDEGRTAFAKWGDDLSHNLSWQIGVSWYTTAFESRSGGGHDHGEDHEESHEEDNDEAGEPGEAATRFNDGDVTIKGFDFVVKWAPTGNQRNQQLTFQGEYFLRDEEAELTFSEGANELHAQYDGEQAGYYLQSIYRFKPQWRAGIRYDWLEPDNTFDNVTEHGVETAEFFEDTAFNNDEAITRTSIMLDYSRSEFSRIRLQYNHVDVAGETDGQIFLQYTMSLGSHGAHRY